MQNITKYPKYACQFCGSDRKFVETVIDDEFVWSEKENRFQPNKFSNAFQHTGEERCAECNNDWSGFREQS
jgi:hypothetical protein